MTGFLADPASFADPASPGTLSDQPFRIALDRSGSPASIGGRQLMHDGLIRGVVADVFVADDVPDSRRLRAQAAALLIPWRRRQEQSWVIGYASAAWIYTGLFVPAQQPVQPAAPSRLDVIVIAGRSRPSDPCIRSRQSRLSSAEIVLLHGLPVSDPIRTAADVARDVPQGSALGLLDRLGEIEQVTPQQVLHRLATMRYGRNAARARSLVQAWQALR